MTNIEFVEILLSDFYVFVVMLVLNLGILYVLLRRLIHHVLDPYCMMYVMAACANSVPFFLFYEGLITNEKFLYFMLSELMFWIGFLVFKGNYRIQFDTGGEKYQSDDLFHLFVFLFLLVLIIKSYCYFVVGIPLFSESKFSIRQNALTAMLLRTLKLPEMFVVLYSYHILLSHRENLFRKTIVSISFFVLFCYSFLSGSKGFILSYVYLYFGYMFFYRKTRFRITERGKLAIQRKKLNIPLKFLVPIVFSPLPVIAIYYGSSGLNGAGLLLYRFVASGDGYWQGMVHNVIDNIDNTALWYERLFSFVLGPLGLISQNAKIPIGTLILNQINPGTIGLLEGANSRIPIFTWVCFGWFGIVGSFILGMVARIFAYGKLISAPHDIVGLTVLFSLYSLSAAMVTDPTMFGAGLIDIIFGVIIFNLYSMILCGNRGFILFK